MTFKFHIGMRKIKSLLAVTLSFSVWQLIRLFFPMLDVHPLFAYIYSVIEMRESPEKTKDFGKLRIRATLTGLAVGLAFITLSAWVSPMMPTEWLHTGAEFGFILLATLCALCLAEVTGCKNFCGIAAIITIICMVSHNEEDIYLYAIMRVVQTLIGIFSAMLVNVFVRKKDINQDQGKG